MVEKIANTLNVEPFKLFVDDTSRDKSLIDGNTPIANDCLECLTTIERQGLAKRIMALISNDLERILLPEKR